MGNSYVLIIVINCENLSIVALRPAMSLGKELKKTQKSNPEYN